MAYIVFLMRHGLRPYRDIQDMNFPGCYLVQTAVMRMGGGSSLGWRCFDLLLGAAATAAMVFICRPAGRAAGLIAGTLFIVLHGRDGVAQTGQRDLVMAVALLFACSAALHAARSRQDWWYMACGCFVGVAATIKPTGLLFAALWLPLICYQARAASGKVMRPVLLAMTGLLLPGVVVVLSFWHWHALRAFVSTVSGMAAYHAGLDRQTFGYLALHSFSPLLPLLPIWLVLPVFASLQKHKERLWLASGIVCGFLSYWIQGKGYQYHRYPMLVFLLCLLGFDFNVAARQRGIRRILGIAGLGTASLVLTPISARIAARYDWRNQEFISMLQKDLNALGGAGLSGSVQCLDTTDGCINTLYRMRLMQSTGLIYDCYVLEQDQTAATAEMRRRFWQQLAASPARVIVASNQYCLNGKPGFKKLDNWPQLRDLLDRDYYVYASRTPPDTVYWWSRQSPPGSYRVYVHK